MASVHVAVGVIKNSDGKILIAKRPDKSHQGGLWEFPGGKVEPKETLFDALKRELKEELGIAIYGSTPLIKIAHDYGDKQVLLDVHWVTDFDGQSISHGDNFGKEGQPIAWVDVNSLGQYQFPAANNPIIAAIQLPSRYAITGLFNSEIECLNGIRGLLQTEIKLIQLRAKQLTFLEFQQLAKSALALCKPFDACLQVNLSLNHFQLLNLSDENLGLHLTSSELMLSNQRPADKNIWCSASCHTLVEIEHAKRVGVDFICLSPVQKTNSHPEAAAIGWENFSYLSAQAACPVYALGGLSEADIPTAINSGAQGVAAIEAWWQV